MLIVQNLIEQKSFKPYVNSNKHYLNNKLITHVIFLFDKWQKSVNQFFNWTKCLVIKFKFIRKFIEHIVIEQILCVGAGLAQISWAYGQGAQSPHRARPGSTLLTHM